MNTENNTSMIVRGNVIYVYALEKKFKINNVRLISETKYPHVTNFFGFVNEHLIEFVVNCGLKQPLIIFYFNNKSESIEITHEFQERILNELNILCESLNYELMSVNS